MKELKNIANEENIIIKSDKLLTWFMNYKGMCGYIFGYEKGHIAFPKDYKCQAEKIFYEMKNILNINTNE
jgi:hypothetical protein